MDEDLHLRKNILSNRTGYFFFKRKSLLQRGSRGLSFKAKRFFYVYLWFIYGCLFFFFSKAHEPV